MAESVRQRSHEHQDAWDKFWKDKDGNVIVWQRPNWWLLGWALITIVSLFLNGTLSNILWYVALVVLAIWSLLEIFKGVNYLRRTLGVVVLILIVLAIFKVGY